LAVPLLGSISSCSVTDSDNVSPLLQGQSHDAPPRAAAIAAASSAQNSSSSAATAAAAATSDSPTARRRAAEPASRTNMNVHMAQGDGREPPIPPDRRECALSRRALEGQRHARAEQQQRQQRRASVPRPAKGCGDSCTDMSVNMTQLISRRARRARRRRDKQRRERALSLGAPVEQRQQRAEQQQQQQRRAAVPRPVKGRGVSCALT
jgi:hypothetical protein